MQDRQAKEALEDINAILAISTIHLVEFRENLFNISKDMGKTFDTVAKLAVNPLLPEAFEVIKAANLGYARSNIPIPGFVSGYCLSKDPYIFEMNFLKDHNRRDFHSLWYYARRANDYLIDFCINKIKQNIKINKKTCVAILGLSFKENVDDFRLSHSIEIINLLIKNGVCHLKLYDPYLNDNKYTTLPSSILKFVTSESNILNEEFFSGVDGIIICTRHNELVKLNNKKKLTTLLKKANNPCLIFDGWNIWKLAKTIKNINYEGIGI